MQAQQMVTNRYHIIKKIGEGGMGIVYHVYDRLNREDVALKSVAVNPQKLRFNSRYSEKDLQLSLAREFRILASLRHPHIISVKDYGKDVHPFFTMPLLENAVVIHDRPIAQSNTEKLALLKQLIMALDYLHRNGIVHRDLKPSNVLVTSDNNVQVLDFGIAIEFGRAHTKAGTLAYTAPEIIEGREATFQSDYYSLGMLAYEMFAGAYPYTYDTDMELIEQIMVGELATLPNDVPDAMKQTIRKLLAKDETLRPDLAMVIQTVNNLLDDTSEPIHIRESYIQGSRFIGRKDEFKQLYRAFHETCIKHGQSCLWLIGGESGVGKSRLVDEINIRSMAKGILTIKGQAIEGSRNIFPLWRNIVPRLLLQVDISAEQASILKDIVPDIDQLLMYPVDDAPRAVGDAYVERIAMTIAQLIINTEIPMLIVLEDLQWSALGDLIVLTYLQQHPNLKSVFVLGTYRSDEAPDLPQSIENSRQLQLKRLSRDEIAELSMSILGQGVDIDKLIPFLDKHTEGNALFIVEAFRALAETHGNLRSVATHPLPEHIFTDGMYRVLSRRINQVADHDLYILRLSAVYGRQLDLHVLAQSVEETLLTAWTYKMAHRAILSVEGDVWHFAHDKLRETILADLGADQRWQLHHTIAAGIERAYPDVTEYNEVLLEHWHQAGNLDKEIDYLLPVSNFYLHVICDYRTGLHLTERGLAQVGEQDSRRTRLLTITANFYIRFGQFDIALEHAQNAVEIGEQHNQQDVLASAHNTQGVILFRLGKLDDAEQSFLVSLRIRELQGNNKLVAGCYNNLAAIAISARDWDMGTDYLSNALAIYRQLEDKQGVLNCLINLANMNHQRFQLDDSLEYGEQAFQLAMKLDDRFNICKLYNLLGRVNVDSGNYEVGKTNLRHGLEMAQQLESSHQVALALYNLARTAYFEREYEQGMKYISQSIEIRKANNLQLETHYIVRGDIAYRMGEIATARIYYEKAVQGLRLGKNYIGYARALIGLCFVTTGQVQTENIKLLLPLVKHLESGPVLLECISALVLFLAQRSDYEAAYSAIAYVRQHDKYEIHYDYREDVTLKLLNITIDNLHDNRHDTSSCLDSILGSVQPHL